MRIQTREATLDEFAHLSERGLNLYVILDACDAPAVPEKVRRLGDGLAGSLYNGTAQEDYWAIAPYLCKVDTALLRWILETLWHEPWGIAVVTTADLAVVRAHLRKFLIVQSPEGEHWYFRFYDPRVLPVFLESSNETELREFFGPIQAYAVHKPDAPRLRIMRGVEE